LGKVAITEVEFFSRMLLPRWIQSFDYLVLLGGIAVAAAGWIRLLHNPLVEILLTAGLSRRECVAWSFVGNLGAMAAHVLCFSLCVGIILLMKGLGGGILPIIVGSLSVAWWMAIVLSWSLVVTMITDNQMSVLFVLVLIFFVIGPLIGAVNLDGRPLLVGLALVAPPTQAMVDWTTSMVIGQEPTSLPFLPVTLVPLSCLLLGGMLFERRDL
jgi:ABC-type transport system involved in multi-copper enzyme maturation permease subunit